MPMIVHVHGGHAKPESDGYPEAWYLPYASDIPEGFASEGTFVNRFQRKTNLNGAARFHDNNQPSATLWFHASPPRNGQVCTIAGLASDEKAKSAWSKPCTIVRLRRACERGRRRMHRQSMINLTSGIPGLRRRGKSQLAHSFPCARLRRSENETTATGLEPWLNFSTETAKQAVGDPKVEVPADHAGSGSGPSIFSQPDGSSRGPSKRSRQDGATLDDPFAGVPRRECAGAGGPHA